LIKLPSTDQKVVVTPPCPSTQPVPPELGGTPKKGDLHPQGLRTEHQDFAADASLFCREMSLPIG